MHHQKRVAVRVTQVSRAIAHSSAFQLGKHHLFRTQSVCSLGVGTRKRVQKLQYLDSEKPEVRVTYKQLRHCAVLMGSQHGHVQARCIRYANYMQNTCVGLPTCKYQM